MQGTIERPDGITIPFAVDGDGSKRIVFAHGLTGQGRHEREAVEPLVEAGWTVATFDQRGHAGATPVTDPSVYDADAMGGDLLALAGHLGWERPWIGGGSMGAATSLRAALHARDRIAGLVQVVPAIWRTAHPQIAMFDVYAAMVAEKGIEGAIEAVTAFMKQMDAPEGALERLEDLRAHDAKSLECALRTVPRWVMPGIEEELRAFNLPVVVLAWDGDPIHPLPIGEAMANVLPNAKLIVGDFKVANVDRRAVGRWLLEALP